MKKLLLGFATVLCLVATAEPARAQDWPQQKIQIIVSFGPGGGADIVGRILAEAMQDRFAGHPSRHDRAFALNRFRRVIFGT